MATGEAAQAVSQAPARAAGGIRGFFTRLKNAPPWVWIAILVAVIGVIVAIMQYRKSRAQANGTSSGATDTSAGSVPGGGGGQPNWPATDMSSFQTGNVAELEALIQYLLSLQTPNPPPTAKPPIPTGAPPFQFQPPVQGGGGNGGGGITSGGYGLGPVPGKIMDVQPWQQGRFGRFAGRFGLGGNGQPAQQITPPPAASGGTVPYPLSDKGDTRTIMRKPPVRF